MPSLLKFGQFARYLSIAFIPIWVMLALPFVTLPAHAQGPLLTPTPLPAIVATKNAADQRQSAAQAQIDAALQMEQQAAEMKRNGEAQLAQAQAEQEAARQAAAVQNGVAVGEAIGREEATLNQLRDTVRGQAQLLDESINIQASQAITIEQQRQQIQALEIDKRTILANFNAVSESKAQAEKGSDSNIVVVLVIGLLVLCVLAVVVVAWRQRRVTVTAHDDSDDDPVDAEFDVSKVE